MSWHLAVISRRPDLVTLTLPDIPSIRIEAATLEQAMEMGQRALSNHLDARRSLGRPVQKPLTLEDIAEHDPQLSYGLLATSSVTSETTGPSDPALAQAHALIRRPHCQSARFQLGSVSVGLGFNAVAHAKHDVALPVRDFKTPSRLKRKPLSG